MIDTLENLDRLIHVVPGTLLVSLGIIIALALVSAWYRETVY